MNKLFFLILYRIAIRKKWYFLGMILLTVFLGATISINSYLIKEILDLVEFPQNVRQENFMRLIVWWAIIYGLWWEVCNGLWRSYDYLYMKSMPFIKADVIDMYFCHIQRRGNGFFKENLSGFVSNKIMDASRTCETILANFNEQILRKICTIVIALCALFYVKPVFASIFIIWLSVFFCISALFMNHIQRLSFIWASKRSTIAGQIIDSINNIYSIRMFNLYHSERQNLTVHLNNTVRAEVVLNWFMLKIRYFQGLSCSIMIFFMIYYLGIYKSIGEITTGDFALVLTLSVAIMEDLWDFVQDIGDWFEDIGAFAQTLDLLEKHEIEDTCAPKDFKVETASVEFRDVSFGYDKHKKLFTNLSINIAAKQRVGIVGTSGSGKTSFINLITRLYNIESGQILIDGQNISEVSQDDLRHNIAIIPQDLTLFDRSVMENIRYGKMNSSDEEIFDATKKAKIHQDILGFSDGYNTKVGEKGCKLSGGQRQRIIIARAILKNAPILILDEATSAQDALTEEYIKDSLKYLMQEKTTITIAHRISTLKSMDRILVFEEGRIVADGDHSDLYQNSKIYRDLWDAQMQGYIVD